MTCDAEEVAAASADAEPIAFDDLGHRNILAPPVVRAIGAFLLCQHRALVAKHCGGLSVHGSDAKELSQVIAVPSIVR